MADIMDKFWSAPPVTRTIVAAMFTTSALCYSGMLSFHHVIFSSRYIFKVLPELWRLMSAFLITGPKFSFLFDLYMTWNYGSGLELKSQRFTQPGDFFTYVAFIAVVIVIVDGLLLGAFLFTSPLILAFVYTFAQDNRGTKAHFYFFQIPVEVLPWAMLTMTMIFDGGYAALGQGSGIVAAHLYDFLTRLYPTFQGGRNYIQTPAAIKRYFGAGQGQYTNRGYGQAFRPAQSNPQPQSRGWTSGFSNSWGGRGAGRRLGGD